MAGSFSLTEHVHTCNVALFGFDILCTLNKHTAGTAAGVIKRAVERLDKSGYEFDNIVRSVKLAVLFGGVHRKRFQEILINAPYQIAFLAECLVRYFIHLVHDFLLSRWAVYLLW